MIQGMSKEGRTKLISEFKGYTKPEGSFLPFGSHKHYYFEFMHNGEKVILADPHTYMMIERE